MVYEMCLFYSIFLEEEAYYCLYLLKFKKKKKKIFLYFISFWLQGNDAVFI